MFSLIRSAKQKVITRKYNAVFYRFTLETFLKGYKKEFEEEDIYKVVKNCKSKICGDKIEKKWQTTPTLMKVLFHQFGFNYLLISLVNIVWTETNR